MSRELDRKVAEKLGWNQIKVIDDITCGILPPTRGWAPIPCWQTDLNAAIELWELSWWLAQTDTGWEVCYKENQLAEAKTPAEAIVLAFLAEK